MSVVKVNRVDRNLELVSKIMNSVAVKYDCRVRYNRDTHVLDFSGDERLRRFIAEETLAFLRNS